MTRGKRGLEALLLAVLLAVVALLDLDDLTFHADESSRIASSKSFEALVGLDFDSPVWEERHLMLTQPPLSRYVIGVGRTLGGYDASALNTSWQWDRSDAANIKAGAMPSPALLWWSRLPMAVLAVGSGLLLFLLARAIAGPAGGYAILLLYVANDYVLYTIRLALGEGPLLAAALLATVAACQAVRHWPRAADAATPSWRAYRPALVWLTVCGVAGGLAGAAKLNGLAAALAGVVMAVVLALAGDRGLSLARRAGLALAGGALVALSAAAVFVAVNPFLYSDPVGRSLEMLAFRVDEMEQQYEATPPSRIADLHDRLTIVPQRVFKQHATLDFPLALRLNLALTAAGFAYLLYRSGRWLRGDQAAGAAMVALVFGVTLSAPALLTPLDWPRYFLFPVVFSTLCIAVALGGAARWLWSQRRAANQAISASRGGSGV